MSGMTKKELQAWLFTCPSPDYHVVEWVEDGLVKVHFIVEKDNTNGI